MVSRTVLIVNDEKKLKLLLDRYVSEAGAKAASVETFQEAVVFLRLLQPDIIVVNMHLKQMQALPLLQRLRAHPLTEHIPVVIIALFSTSVDLQPFIAARTGSLLLLLSGDTEHMLSQIRETVAIALLKNDQVDGHRKSL